MGGRYSPKFCISSITNECGMVAIVKWEQKENFIGAMPRFSVSESGL